MTVVESALAPYEAFSSQEGRPPAFVVHAHDEASVFPYEELIGVIWLQNEHQIFVAHHFFNLYFHGKHLEPLLEAFGRYAVHKIHVFDEARHAPVAAGTTVITHIDDHYEADRPVTAARRKKAG